MPFIIADRVRETSTTVGTGSIALAGAVTGYQTFDAVLDTGDTTYYTVADQGGNNWEVGIGTFTAPSTLARTTILSSSNGGSIVTFGAGIKDVFISLPASKTNVEDQPNLIEVNSSSPALRITQTGTGNALLVEDSANPDATPFVVTADGNVGIGTTAPSATLNIYNATSSQILTQGDAATNIIVNRASSDTGRPGLVIRKSRGTVASPAAVNSGDPLGTIFFQGFGGTNIRSLSQIWGNVETYTSDTDISSNITFLTSPSGSASGVEVMRITSGGNVGIGTSSPGARLDVSSGGNNIVASRSTGGYAAFQRFAPTGQQTYDFYNVNNVEVARITADASNFLSFSTGSSGTERMRIDASGNVGIGTAAPISSLGRSLHLYNDANTGNVASNATLAVESVNRNAVLDLSGSASASNSVVFSDVVGTGVASLVSEIANQNLIFRTGGTSERMRITSSGNVGIGTSSPAQKLDVYDVGVPAIRLANNTTSIVSYVDANFGVTGTSTNHSYIITTNNSERVRIDTSGNVGIGTTGLGARLSIVAPALGTSIIATDNSQSTWYLKHESGTLLTYEVVGTAIQRWVGNGAERMRIDGSGNVGIGTSSPGSKFTVYTSNTDSTNGILVAGGATNKTVMLRPSMGAGSNNNIVQAGDGGIIFDGGTIDTGAFVIAPWANATSGIRIVGSTGNVGIGTASPGARLDVAGNILVRGGLGSEGGEVTLYNPDTTTVGGILDVSTADVTRWFTTRNNSLHQIGQLSGTGGIVALYTAGSERMRITADGNVGIGTVPGVRLNVLAADGVTNSRFAGASFAVRIQSIAGVGAQLEATNNNEATYQPLIVGGSDVRFSTSGTERARITSGGEVYIAGTTDQGAFNLQVNGTGVWGAGAYTNGSDARIKDDIAPIASGLDVVAKLRPVQFRYKESWSKDRSLQPGFIAQELQEALADQPYVEGVVQQGPEYMSVAYQTLIPVLVKAVQELTAKVAALESNK